MVCNKKILYIFSIIITVSLILIFYTNKLNKTSNELKSLKFEDLLEISINKSRHDNKLFNLNLKYNLKPPECGADDILAVIIVSSNFGNVEVRSGMRRSFPNDVLTQHNVRRVFLLGVNDEDKYTKQNAIDDESNRFEDILQGNFHEAYRNLTYKHLMGLKWASESCARAKYIIKMDDDIVINFLKVINLLKEINLPERLLAGYILEGMKPIREKANKWYVSDTEYYDSNYPTFLSGWFYITNPMTSEKLVALSKFQPYFWIDDTYITGILAKLIKITHFNIGNWFTVHPEFLNCCMQDVKKYNYDCEVIVGPNGGDNNLFYEFNKAMITCFNEKCKERIKPLNDTCVSKRKLVLGKGDSKIDTYKL